MGECRSYDGKLVLMPRAKALIIYDRELLEKQNQSNQNKTKSQVILYYNVLLLVLIHLQVTRLVYRDEKTVVAIGEDNSLTLYDTQNGNPVSTFSPLAQLTGSPGSVLAGDLKV